MKVQLSDPKVVAALNVALTEALKCYFNCYVVRTDKMSPTVVRFNFNYSVEVDPVWERFERQIWALGYENLKVEVKDSISLGTTVAIVREV